MRFNGKVAEFNRSTGRGIISRNGAGVAAAFQVSELRGVGEVDVGANVSFELSFIAGKACATNVAVASPRTQSAAEVRNAVLGTAIGEIDANWVAQRAAELPPLQDSSAVIAGSSKPASLQASSSSLAPSPTDKVECGHCGKLMIPRLVTFKGKPERSFCPFCGGVHIDFRSGLSPLASAGLLAFVAGSILG